MSELTRILYVEDELDIQAITRLALETVGGLTLRICSSGAEALEHAESFDPDLILLDVMMPEMDGIATMKALMEIPAISGRPCVFMTAKVQPHEVARYRELGAVDVISKPFDPMKLATRIREIWDELDGD